MLVRHRAALDRLALQIERWCEISVDLGELALCLHRQRVSIELVALPLLRLAGHRDHVVVRFLGVCVRPVFVATQRVDTRAQRDEESGFTDAFARVMILQVAPLRLQLEDVVPPIHPEQALGLDAECVRHLIDRLDAGGLVFGFAQIR